MRSKDEAGIHFPHTFFFPPRTLSFPPPQIFLPISLARRLNLLLSYQIE
jgi:hypothetical protein